MSLYSRLAEGNPQLPTMQGSTEGNATSYDFNFPSDTTETMGNPLLESLELNNGGRLGDTELRVVAGEESHVNPMEARFIDKYGNLGEKIVQNIGTGNTNPNTGKKEYNPMLGATLAGTAVQLGAGYFANRAMNQALRSSRRQMKQGLANVEDYRTMGKDFLDPTSNQNRMFLRNIENQGMNQVALSNLQSARQATSMGGGFSGALLQAGKQATMDVGAQARQQWLGSMAQQQQTGLSMINTANQQEQGIRDSLAELHLAKGTGQAGMLTAGASGFSSGLLDAYRPSPAAGGASNVFNFASQPYPAMTGGDNS